MLYYFGVCLWVWLLVGFITGVKNVFIAKSIDRIIRENKDVAKELDIDDELGRRLVAMMKHKPTYIAILSLFGFVSFWLDFRKTFFKKGK